jgi:hypothetical protein
MDSAELAELVAMASDLTDVTDSESETGKSASTKTEEISTMTTNESLSVSRKHKTSKLSQDETRMRVHENWQSCELG